MPATTAACLNKTHGHDMVGPVCVRCGMRQEQIDALFSATMRPKGASAVRKRRPKPTFRAPKVLSPAMARRTMHSAKHALAKDISEFVGEEKLFAQYLGRIVDVGLPVSYKAFSELKDRMRARKIVYPGRWWMWKTKELTEGKKSLK